MHPASSARFIRGMDHPSTVEAREDIIIPNQTLENGSLRFSSLRIEQGSNLGRKMGAEKLEICGRHIFLPPFFCLSRCVDPHFRKRFW